MLFMIALRVLRRVTRKMTFSCSLSPAEMLAFTPRSILSSTMLFRLYLLILLAFVIYAYVTFYVL